MSGAYKILSFIVDAWKIVATVDQLFFRGGIFYIPGKSREDPTSRLGASTSSRKQWFTLEQNSFQIPDKSKRE